MYIFSSFYYFGLLFTYYLLACVLTRWNLIPSIWFCFSNSTTEFELRYSVFKVLPKFSIIEFRAPCDYASALGFSTTEPSRKSQCTPLHPPSRRLGILGCRVAPRQAIRSDGQDSI